ncbi:hypothetical protein HF521_020071 [Silurus meridionalis]|uniref:C-C motif chemokine n=1 Tax=Silurus meridionalis TaxID=175797 RepID=A0A8T0BML0_SILME|nr:hypothetical protein HF521_020071 [Silurus meridionalis]
MAENSIGPATCCFSYQRTPIPIRVITGYKVTDRQCTKPGVIFTLKSSRQVCVDPEVKWVQKHMEKIDQILNEIESSVNVPDSCCFSYHNNPIPIRVITGYKVTDRHCSKPGVVFTLMNKRQVCVDPEHEWVQNHMKKIDEILNKFELSV